MGLFALIQPWIDLIWGWISILLLTELFLVLLFSLVQPFRYHSCEPEVPSPWWTLSSSFYFLNPVRLCSASLSLNHPFLFSLKLYEHLFWFFPPALLKYNWLAITLYPQPLTPFLLWISNSLEGRNGPTLVSPQCLSSLSRTLPLISAAVVTPLMALNR